MLQAILVSNSSSQQYVSTTAIHPFRPPPLPPLHRYCLTSHIPRLHRTQQQELHRKVSNSTAATSLPLYLSTPLPLYLSTSPPLSPPPRCLKATPPFTGHSSSSRFTVSTGATRHFTVSLSQSDPSFTGRSIRVGSE